MISQAEEFVELIQVATNNLPVRQEDIELKYKTVQICMASILTYNVSDKQLELKKALFDLGYKSTLYHATKTPEQAAIDVKNLCECLKIDLAQCLATNLVEWHTISDQSFK